MDNFGQLLVSGIKGITLLPEEKDFIKNEKLGGIILFSHNFEDPGQLAELVNSIQKLRDEYPLFISVDQEGGRIMRFKKHFTQFPPMLDVASLDSPKLVFELHQVIAKELSACAGEMIPAASCDWIMNGRERLIAPCVVVNNVDQVAGVIIKFCLSLT